MQTHFTHIHLRVIEDYLARPRHSVILPITAQQPPPPLW